MIKKIKNILFGTMTEKELEFSLAHNLRKLLNEHELQTEHYYELFRKDTLQLIKIVEKYSKDKLILFHLPNNDIKSCFPSFKDRQSDLDSILAKYTIQYSDTIEKYFDMLSQYREFQNQFVLETENALKKNFEKPKNFNHVKQSIFDELDIPDYTQLFTKCSITESCLKIAHIPEYIEQIQNDIQNAKNNTNLKKQQEMIEFEDKKKSNNLRRNINNMLNKCSRI